MIDLIQELFPYLVGFYLLDCLLYVGRGRLAFVSVLGKRFRVSEAGLRVILPWPTVRVVFGEDLLVGVSSSGLHAVAHDVSSHGILPDPEQFDVQDPAIVAVAEVEGPALVHRGRRLCTAASPSGARAIRDFAASLRSEPPSGSNRWLGRVADVAAVRARRASFEAHVARLRVLSVIVWLLTFGLLPWAAYRGDAAPPLGLVLMTLALAYVAAVWAANAALRASGVARSERVRALLPIAFFPPSAGHILAVVEREIYHPAATITVAAGFLDVVSFERFARRHVHRIAAARRAASGTLAEPVWSTQYEVSDQVIRATGKSTAALLQAPAPRTDDTAASWCPICTTEYLTGVSSCSDCGVELTAY